MGEIPYDTDTIVRHPARPDWGPGRVRKVDGSKVTVYFRDTTRPVRTISTDHVDLEILEDYRDGLLENLPEWTGEEDDTSLEKVPIGHGIAWFLKRYPDGFDDPGYLHDPDTQERGYKLAAHEVFRTTLDPDARESLLARGDVEELTRRALAVVGRVNLLSPYEQMALRDGLQDETAAERYLRALFRLLDSDSMKEPFENLIEAVERLPRPEKGSRVATWPNLTILPYLARPDRFMFLKPSVTKQCAVRIGFELQYSSTLNWITYKNVLKMSEYLLDRLRKYGARDFIDVQSFIWLIGE